MIELHQYPAIWGLPSLSPFCIKVEFFLKANKIPYQVILEKNPATGPKGKMPFIREANVTVADSSFILDYLQQRYCLPKQEEFGEKARTLAFKAMIEEALYFILLYNRWVDPVGFEGIIKDFPKLFPPLVGVPFLYLIRRNLIKQAYYQGVGRHTKDEVYGLGKNYLAAISDYLGDRLYIGGTNPAELDYTLFAFLITIQKQPMQTDLKKALFEFPNLVDYSIRIDEEFLYLFSVI